MRKFWGGHSRYFIARMTYYNKYFLWIQKSIHRFSNYIRKLYDSYSTVSCFCWAYTAQIYLRRKKVIICCSLQGDGGDPLQIINEKYPNIYDIIGITSFGYMCNVISIPVYATRVSSYVPWIENIVWPEKMMQLKVIVLNSYNTNF